MAQRSVLRIVDGVSCSLNPDGLDPSIAAGDEAALSRFYDATSGLLFGLLLLILGDTATAEKVLLEVYSEVSQHAVHFDKNQESLLTWLVTIAHRRALEHLCSSSEDQQFLVSVGLANRPGPGPVRHFCISKSAHRRLVGATLNALSPTELKMVELTYFSRMTPHAIALKLRQSPDSVSTSLKYAIAQLYNLFKSQGFLREA
ncbi:MAG: hypothetical protein H7Z16_07925 [Pyrinomonadaceae bacterium]|nr:hypothetical protein [Pyrinomonadaceae bacterium]